MPTLLGIDGFADGQKIPIGTFGLIIGRESPDTPQLRSDFLLAGKHAQIAWGDNGGLFIRDLGSARGTSVNGVPVPSSWLRDGDRIEVGDSVFRVDWPPARPADPPPEPPAASTQYGGDFRADSGGVAVGGNSRDIYSSSARADGDYGVAVGRDYYDTQVEFDPTGFRTARGLARLFLIVGTLVALAGFALFGYPMVQAFGAFERAQAEHDACDRRFEPGQEQVECHLRVSMPAFEFTPWLPLGATVLFSGMVIGMLGTMMNRRTDKQEERARQNRRRR